jgi:hydroxyacylglutathione hydrolase
MTHVEWIGTGAGFNPELGNTSFLIRDSMKHLGNSILVDCGHTVTSALKMKGYLPKVTDIIITHLHDDHVGGLGLLGQINCFAYENHGNRPRLYLASDEMAHELWESCLKAGMQYGGSNVTKKFNIDDYFDVRVGEYIRFHHRPLPDVQFRFTPHVPGMENYGLMIGGNVYYSGDTTVMPPFDAKLIFQDCQFWRGGVHISLEELAAMPDYVKANTNLEHLGETFKDINPVELGFPKFVMPGDIFDLKPYL